MLALVYPLLQVLPFVMLGVVRMPSLGTDQRKFLDLGCSYFRSSVTTTQNGQRQCTITVKGGNVKREGSGETMKLAHRIQYSKQQERWRAEKVLCIHNKKRPTMDEQRSKHSSPHVKS